jgi:hypothetical protein
LRATRYAGCALRVPKRRLAAQPVRLTNSPSRVRIPGLKARTDNPSPRSTGAAAGCTPAAKAAGRGYATACITEYDDIGRLLPGPRCGEMDRSMAARRLVGDAEWMRLRTDFLVKGENSGPAQPRHHRCELRITFGVKHEVLPS